MTERDPFDAELRRLLRGKDRLVHPSPDFSNRLQARLQAELASSPRHTESEPTMLARPIQHARPVEIGRPTPIHRTVVSAVGLAAVLLAIIVGVRLLAAPTLHHPSAAPTTGPTTSRAAAVASPSPAAPAGSTAAMVDGNPGRTGRVDLDGPSDIGGILWSTDGTGVAPSALQAVTSGSTVYQVRPAVNGENDGTSTGYLEAIDAASGQRLWSAPLDWAGTPLVWNDLVIVPVWASSADESLPNGQAAFAAYSTASGDRRWVTPLPGSTFAYGFLDLIAVDGVVYGGGSNGQISAVEAGSGKLLWQSSEGLYAEPLDEGHPFPFQPAQVTYSHGSLFEVTPAGNLLALSPTDGHLLWSVDVAERLGVASVSSRLLGTDSGLLLLVTEKPADLSQMPDTTHWMLFDPAQGDSLRDGTLDGWFAGPIVVDNTLFVGLRSLEAHRASLVRLNLANGKTTGTQDLRDTTEIIGVTGSDSNRLYIAFATGQVAVYAMNDLGVDSTVDTGTSLSGAPLLVGGAVIVQKGNQGLLALGPAVATAATSVPKPAAMANGNPSLSGEVDDPGPSSLATVTALDVTTDYDTPMGGKQPFGADLTNASALGGTLFAVVQIPIDDQPTDGGFGTAGHLRAIDIASNTIEWDLGPEYANFFDTVPLATDDLVVTTVMESGADGEDGGSQVSLVAFDAETGTERWRTKLSSTAGSFFSLSAPILVDGVIYISAPDATVFAIELRSGNVTWTADAAKTIAPDTDESTFWQKPNRVGTIAFRDDQLYVVAPDGSIVALDPANGGERWRFDTRNQLRSGFDPLNIVAADGGLIVIANMIPVSGNHAVTKLVRLDAEHGTIEWVKTIDAYVEWVGLSGETLITAVNPNDRTTTLTAYDVRTGDSSHTATLDSGGYAVGFAIAGGRLLVTQTDGVVSSLDPDTLAVESKIDTGHELTGRILVTDDLVLVNASGALLVVSGG